MLLSENRTLALWQLKNRKKHSKRLVDGYFVPKAFLFQQKRLITLFLDGTFSNQVSLRETRISSVCINTFVLQNETNSVTYKVVLSFVGINYIYRTLTKFIPTFWLQKVCQRNWDILVAVWMFYMLQMRWHLEDHIWLLTTVYTH